MGQINTTNYPTVSSLADADLLIVENAVHGTGTTTPKQLRENAIGTDPLQTSAQTVTGAINELKDKIGTDPLQTVSQTLTGAVNELKNGEYLGINMGKVTGVSSQVATTNIDLKRMPKAGERILVNFEEPTPNVTSLKTFIDGSGITIPISSGEPSNTYAGLYIFECASGVQPMSRLWNVVGKNYSGFTVDVDGNVKAAGDITDGSGNTLSVVADSVSSVKTVTGNPVIVEDALKSNADSLVAQIVPIQDLHGYDHPWVGGAGKNKLPMTVSAIKAANTSGTWSGNVYSIANATYEILTDAAGNVTGFEINGTFSATVSIKLLLPTPKQDSYILTGCPSGGGTSTYRHWCGIRNSNNSGWITSFLETGSGHNFSVDAESAYIQVEVEVINGYTANHVVFKPMIRLATESDATFEPWSNICPISGRTAVNVGNNNNLFDEVYDNIDGNVHYKPIYVGDGSFTMTTEATGSSSFALLFFLAGDVSSGANSANNGVYNGQNRTVTAVNGYVTVAYRKGQAEAQTPVGKLTTVVRSGETYTAQTLTIPLGQTVYGGNQNFTEGSGRSDMGFVEFDGSEDEIWGMSSGSNYYQFHITISNAKNMVNFVTNEFQRMHIYYRGQQTGAIYYSDNMLRVALLPNMNITTVAQWRAWLAQNPLQVCYELATPTTVQLTANELEMLMGYNRLTSDSGDITLTYKANAVQDLQNDKADNADMVDFIENGNKASRAYTANQFMLWKGDLYKVTTSIASGATITAGTNVTKTTIGAVLTALLNA